MKVQDKLRAYKDVGLRPISATNMLWRHRRTLKYLLFQRRYRNLYNHIFTTYLVRGEDCGKGILDPIWKLTGWSPFLWDLEIEITTKCYLKCTHCEHTYWKDKSYLNQDLKFDDFKKIIDGIPNLRWLNVTGEGSAFLNPDFMDMVRYAKSKGVYVDFSHDFAHITPQEMKDLILIGVDRIYWSFDGCTKETYEKIRIGASFIQVCQNIQDFLILKSFYNSPLPEICFRYAFFKDNVHEVEMIPQLLADIVNKVSDYGDEPSINIVSLLEFEETKDWVVEVSEDVVRETDKMSKAYGFTNYWSHPTHNEDNKPPLDWCTFWSEPYIMITGHVVPCCGVLMSNNRPELERLSFGNIYEQPLRDIWFSEGYRKFRKMVVNPRAPVPEVCVDCRVFNTQNRKRRYGVE